MSKIRIAIALIRFIFILPGVRWSDKAFCMDLERWRKIKNLQLSDKKSVALFLWSCPEYRNLFIYRNRNRRFYRYWIRVWYKPMDTLFIESKQIGGGLYIQHGFATMIAAESIGENCWINQQVTIGYSNGDRAPIIGNNVMITCGAKVLGSISVGDDVVVGANAVVVKDVESGSVVGGIPAKRIK